MYVSMHPSTHSTNEAPEIPWLPPNDKLCKV